jgi:hypothetical protein
MSISFVRKLVRPLFSCAVVSCAVLGARSAQAQSCDLTTCNGPRDVVIPVLVPNVLATLGHGDASLILRVTALLTNGWFDADAPYHPTAVGVYSSLGRRPASDRTNNKKRNIALLVASYRILDNLLPRQHDAWLTILTANGIDPKDTHRDQITPIGIGNSAAAAIIAARAHDGMNQLGDEGGVKYNRHPYAEYLGYHPVNTAYQITDPAHWQPNITTSDNGIFTVQQFVTPEIGVTQPYSFDLGDIQFAPPPVASDPNIDYSAYKAQADQVLSISAGLTDAQKMTAELFDHKFNSLATAAGFAAQQANLGLDEFVQYEFLTNVGSFDGAIAIWRNKYMYDSVRPFTAIHWLYADKQVTAWGGPGKGRVTDLNGSDWQSYLHTANHPEYPSGSSCFCAVHAQASRRYFGSDQLGWSTTFKAGSSEIEPGVTPAQDVTLTYATWTDFENQCKLSRVLGGVHFPPSTTAGGDLCRPIGDLAYQFVKAHIDGRRKGS